MIRNWLWTASVTLDDAEADRLRRSVPEWSAVELRPDRTGDGAARLSSVIGEVLELQSRYTVFNASPVTCFEIQRPRPDTLRVQVVVPTERLRRKVIAGVAHEAPPTGFADGETGLPVRPGDSIGGGMVTTGRPDYFPFDTDPDGSVVDAVVSRLHRHAMQDTRVVVQFLLRPIAGQPLRRWWWRKWAYKRQAYLRQEKHALLRRRTATPRERGQADAIEEKAGTARFHAAIRFLVVGAGEYTRSRVKELASAFNVLEDAESGQYMDTVTVKGLRRKRLLNFAEAVHRRAFDDWTQRFRVTPSEAAVLIGVPTVTQANLQYAQI